MKRLFTENHRLPYRVLTGILLSIYLSIFPAVIYCNLHCDIDNSNIISANLDHEHTIHAHNHDHSQSDSTPQSSPLHKDKATEDKYSFCLFAQSVPSVGISTNPLHITGIFEATESPLFTQEEGISHVFYASIRNRAPPIASLV